MSGDTLRSVLVICVTGIALSGCFVVDELDAANDILDHHSTRSEAGADAEESEEGVVTAAGLESKFWQKARSLVPAEKTSDIVSCTIAGSQRFMRKSDCQSQGGRF